jgi:hypothetical protein
MFEELSSCKGIGENWGWVKERRGGSKGRKGGRDLSESSQKKSPPTVCLIHLLNNT